MFFYSKLRYYLLVFCIAHILGLLLIPEVSILLFKSITCLPLLWVIFSFCSKIFSWNSFRKGVCVVSFLSAFMSNIYFSPHTWLNIRMKENSRSNYAYQNLIFRVFFLFQYPILLMPDPPIIEPPCISFPTTQVMFNLQYPLIW